VANQTGRPVAPARKLVAAVLGTLAVFVMVFGLGLSSWAIVVLGLAVLALSIALGMVNVVRRGARAWVSGTAQVKAVSEPPVSSAYGRAELQLVVVAPGLPVTEVLIRDPRVPVDKWPQRGETLPVSVDVDDMRRVRIDWINAPDRADPPPPGPSFETDAYPDPMDDYDDDLLGEPEPPPWAARERQWGTDPDEPPPPPPPRAADAGDLDDLPGSPVVVRDTPDGTIVEGQLVDREEPPPLPRRARSGPIPSPSPPSDAAAESAVPGPAAAEPPPRPSGSRPSPRPRAAEASEAVAAAATATVGAQDGTDDAPPRAAAPEQRQAPPEFRADDDPRAAGREPVDDEPPAAAQGLADDGPPAGARGPVDVEDSGAPAHDPEIDLPLDGDPEPPPEATDPAARDAVASGLMAAPVDDTGPPDDIASLDETEPPDAPAPPAAPPAPGDVAASDAVAGEPASGVPEVDPSDPPVISGVDAPPSDAAATAAAAGAVAGAAANHTANGRASSGADEQHGPWADLEGGYEPDDQAGEVTTEYPSARPGPSGAIHGVGITVLVTDLDRSVAFYRDTLGFFEIDRGTGSAVLASGGTRLVLRTVRDLSAASGRLVYLNLEVGDVEAVYQELKAKGVAFVHAPRAVNRGDKLELWSATFTDPDRHNIAISQWRAVQ
jgi:catechol 2,3-dioxygenase-like lactoylglutathione lyase family enzyme